MIYTNMTFERNIFGALSSIVRFDLGHTKENRNRSRPHSSSSFVATTLYGSAQWIAEARIPYLRICVYERLAERRVDVLSSVFECKNTSAFDVLIDPSALISFDGKNQLESYRSFVCLSLRLSPVQRVNYVYAVYVTCDNAISKSTRQCVHRYERPSDSHAN